MSIESWCYPAISSSAVPFSFCLQSFPASGSFTMIRLFGSSGQSIGASASASVLPKDWFPLRLAGWVTLHSKGLSRVFSSTTIQKHQFFRVQSIPLPFRSYGQRLLAKHPSLSWGPGAEPTCSWVAGFRSLPAHRIIQANQSHSLVGTMEHPTVLILQSLPPQPSPIQPCIAPRGAWSPPLPGWVHVTNTLQPISTPQCQMSCIQATSITLEWKSHPPMGGGGGMHKSMHSLYQINFLKQSAIGWF